MNKSANRAVLRPRTFLALAITTCLAFVAYPGFAATLPMDARAPKITPASKRIGAYDAHALALDATLYLGELPVAALR